MTAATTAATAPALSKRLGRLGRLGRPASCAPPLGLLILLPAAPLVSAIDFNYEVEKRVVDRIENYMRQSVDTNLLLSNYRFSDGFPSGSLIAPDRDAYLTLTHNIATTPLIYYGLEDGTCTGYYKDASYSTAYYREPGDSGYELDDETMAKHRRTCVDEMSGEAIDCVMDPDSPYVKRCKADDGGLCPLEPCPDADSQADCSLLDDPEEKDLCQRNIKYCRPYTIESSPSEEEVEGGAEPLGFVPTVDFCHDVRGKITQEPGAVVQGYTPSTYDLEMVIDPRDGSSSSVHTLVDCVYGDGETLVNRSLEGEYAYCGGNGKVCNDTFTGGYMQWDYDPRHRPWYVDTKNLQRPAWTDPYPFYEDWAVGITATHPLYDVVDGRNVFVGVLAVDYRFTDITDFLVQSYGDTSTAIVIYEDAEPHNLIATSTGTHATKCPPGEETNIDITGTPSCEPIRTEMFDLSASSNPTDRLLVQAFQRHKEASYPRELLSVRGGGDDGGGSSITDTKTLFLSQGAVYEQLGANLKWRIIVLSPAEDSSSDSVEVDHVLFGPIIVIGALGVAACAALFVTFFKKKREREVINADWRFTCAFILGCGLFNCASFTVLGPNTDALCMLRMWSFHLLFVVALAPLFVKVWRMKQLVGRSLRMQRKAITNKQTVLYMLPMIAVQVLILTVISIVDPPQQREVNEYSEGVVMQRVVCQTNTNALLIVEIVFEAGLILVGCVLAFQTRNIDKRYAESKQLIFAMYNIALVGVIFLIVNFVAGIEPAGLKLLRAIGIFWATVFSSSAFVIPRLLQVRKRHSSVAASMAAAAAANAARGSVLASAKGAVDAKGLGLSMSGNPSSNPEPILRSSIVADKKPSSSSGGTTSSVHWSVEEGSSLGGGRVETLSKASEHEDVENARTTSGGTALTASAESLDRFDIEFENGGH